MRGTNATSTKTSATLLLRVRDSEDAAAWAQFEGRYRELLLRFCRSLGVQHADCEDIIQVVFASLLKGLKGFEYDPAKGRFRDYLFRCARSGLSAWSERPKPAGWPLVPADGGAWVDAEASDRVFEREWMNHHYRMALAAVSQRVDATSVEVLDATVAGVPVPEIARSTGLTEPAVYKVQQRMKGYLKAQIARQVREEDSVDA